MSSAAAPNDIAQRAVLMAPWAYTVFWLGAGAVAASVTLASVKAVGALDGLVAAAAALHAVGLQLLDLAPTIALLSGLWAGCRYLTALARGADLGAATLTVMRDVGDACVWAGLWAMLLTPNIALWAMGAGGFKVKIDAAWLALAGLGLLFGLIGRVFAESLSRAAIVQAELDQVV